MQFHYSKITIGKSIYARGLCYLGASINLMHTSLFKKMGLGIPRPTIIILQLANYPLAKLDGIVEDVLAQVGSLIFLVDFIILDFDVDLKILFILGYPFLDTG